MAITDVARGSAAARAGVAPGMIVESLNGTGIESRAQLEAVARRLEAGKAASMVVRLPGEAGQRTVLNFRVGG